MLRTRFKMTLAPRETVFSRAEICSWEIAAEAKANEIPSCCSNGCLSLRLGTE